ncbi:MAG TPA: glycosyltransferase 87 family protein [Trebonia sp.]
MSADVGLVNDHAVSERGAAGRRGLLIAGVAVAAVAAIAYIVALATHPADKLLNGFDLSVYLGGAGQALHHPGDLYSWTYKGHPGIQFTYTPFAALLFALGRVLSLRVLLGLVAVVSTFSLLATVWIAFRELGWRSLATRTGATLLVGGLMFWTEPVQRGLYLGQVELALMAVVVWDMCQPDSRKWKGAATGIAAGIKLVPALFILYLLVTRRFREAFVGIGAFVVTVIIGFAVLPGPSGPYWFEGNFFQASRTGFVGVFQNQSLRGLLTRLIGSVNGAMAPWLIVAVVVVVAGLAAAVLLHNAGYEFAGLMACALTALLVSPISWDHHWVWIAPGLALIIDVAVRARGGARALWLALGGAVLVVYGAWPDFWSATAGLLHGGLINYAPASSFAHGDNPHYAEYHWHGLQLIAGNLYLLGGLALFVIMLAAAFYVARTRGGVTRLLRAAPAE